MIFPPSSSPLDYTRLRRIGLLVLKKNKMEPNSALGRFKRHLSTN